MTTSSDDTTDSEHAAAPDKSAAPKDAGLDVLDPNGVPLITPPKRRFSTAVLVIGTAVLGVVASVIAYAAGSNSNQAGTPVKGSDFSSSSAATPTPETVLTSSALPTLASPIPTAALIEPPTEVQSQITIKIPTLDGYQTEVPYELGISAKVVDRNSLLVQAGIVHVVEEPDRTYPALQPQGALDATIGRLHVNRLAADGVTVVDSRTISCGASVLDGPSVADSPSVIGTSTANALSAQCATNLALVPVGTYTFSADVVSAENTPVTVNTVEAGPLTIG